MHVCLIQVPYMIGDEHHPASKGPKRFVEAGVERLLTEKGMGVTLECVQRGKPFRDSANAPLAVCKELASIVGRAVAAGQFPLVLAGWRLDLRVRNEDVIVEGEKAVLRWTADGTHSGDLMGIPPTGKTVRLKGVDIIRVANGKIVERWGEFDAMGMMQQLGVIPSPAE